MDFDNPKVYGDTSINDGLIFGLYWCENENMKFNDPQYFDDPQASDDPKGISIGSMYGL